MRNIKIIKGDTILNIEENQIISRDDEKKRLWVNLDNETRAYIKVESIEGEKNYHSFSKEFIETEYIASTILKHINIPVQDVELVEIQYEDEITRLACMCYDITNNTEYKLESFFDIVCRLEDINGSIMTLKIIEDIVNKLPNLNQDEAFNFLYKMFIADMLVGNYDRTCGNIAILKNTQSSIMSPLFDNTSTMGIGLSIDSTDEEIYKQILQTNSAFHYNNKLPINYIYFLKNYENIENIDSNRMKNVIKDVYENIDFNIIEQVFESVTLISEERKQYYLNYFRVAYERVLLPLYIKIK